MGKKFDDEKLGFRKKINEYPEINKNNFFSLMRVTFSNIFFCFGLILKVLNIPHQYIL